MFDDINGPKRPERLTPDLVRWTVLEIETKLLQQGGGTWRIFVSTPDQEHVVSQAGYRALIDPALDGGEWRIETTQTVSAGTVEASVAADETTKESNMKTQNVDTGEALTAEMLEDDRASIFRGDMVVVTGSDRTRLVAMRILDRGDVVKLDPGMLEPDEWAVIPMQTWANRSAAIEEEARVQEEVKSGRGPADDEIQMTHFAPAPVADEVVAPKDDPETASAPEDGGWVFDENVAAAFDDMLSKSIPNYREMRDFCTNATEWVINRQLAPAGSRPKPVVVDLGASRGTGLAPIIARCGDAARYRAYEIAPAMLSELEGRFGRDDRVHVYEHDLRDGAPRQKCDVVLSVLTLQFVPIEHRQKILRQVYESLNPGGALILVEKVLGEAHETNVMLTDLYYGMKAGNGYTEEAIHRKRVSLEGVLVPATAKWNEDLLRGAGFDIVETFWRYLQFSGWMAVKR